MKVSVLIPARMAATRFPGKPLFKILGKPMIQWVYERTRHSMAQRVVVATDSREILRTVREFGGEAAMTSADHQNGTSRIAEVARGMDTDLVINVQGDEPAIHPEAINAVVKPLLADPGVAMSTLATPIILEEDYLDPNIVKVVLDKGGRALYFSRAPIPFTRPGLIPSTRSADPYLRHIGVYGFRKAFLMDYVREPPCELERVECLEQLRALYMGARIQVEFSQYPSVGVDTPADVKKVEMLLKKEGVFHD